MTIGDTAHPERDTPAEVPQGESGCARARHCEYHSYRYFLRRSYQGNVQIVEIYLSGGTDQDVVLLVSNVSVQGLAESEGGIVAVVQQHFGRCDSLSIYKCRDGELPHSGLIFHWTNQ